MLLLSKNYERNMKLKLKKKSHNLQRNTMEAFNRSLSQVSLFKPFCELDSELQIYNLSGLHDLSTVDNIMFKYVWERMACLFKVLIVRFSGWLVQKFPLHYWKKSTGQIACAEFLHLFKSIFHCYLCFKFLCFSSYVYSTGAKDLRAVFLLLFYKLGILEVLSL